LKLASPSDLCSLLLLLPSLLINSTKPKETN
jgi:hypothetical protein